MDSLQSVRPLVGRDAELEHFESVLDALDAGEGRCVTLEGEPGIGKTRLLQELRTRAEERGHVVLAGAGAQFESEVPFSVWVDALDAYVASQDLTGHPRWSPELAAELREVLPSAAAAAHAGAPAIAEERYRTHRAVRSLLCLIAETAPLVLLLDDLHWSDAASIELVASIARRQLGAPVLLALGFRPGQAPEGLTAAVANPRIARLSVAQLNEEQAVRLLAQLGSSGGAGLFREAGGNPFYLEQLGRAGSAGTQPASAVHANGAGVPPAVGAAIAEEIESLPSSARTLLTSAAVAGEPFEPALAAAIGGLAEPEGLAALDDLLSADLVRPTAVPRRFGFRHPLVRQSVYESAGAGWRIGAHARAAQLLAERGAAAGERAHHVEQSATQGDERAIELLLDAGAQAVSRAPAAAARWFEGTLRLLPSKDARQVDVRVDLASSLRSVGQLDRCRATLLEAIDMTGPDDGARRVELTALCAAVEHWQGHHEEAHRRLVRAWSEVEHQQSPEAVVLQIELAVDGMYTLDFADALDHGRAALEDARSLEDRVLIGAAASMLALVEVAAGQVDAARVHRDEAVALIAELSDAELAPRLECLYYLGWAETYLESYAAAIAHADRGISIARATGEGRLLVPLLLVKGYPLEMQARLADAIEVCENAVDIARVSANPHYLFWALFELGWARYFAGDPDSAVPVLEESARVGGRLAGGTMPSVAGGPGWALALCRLETGDAAGALEIMQGLGGEDADQHVPVERCFDWESLALAHIALGHVDAADALAARAEQHAQGMGLSLPLGLAARTRGAVELARGDPAAGAAAATASVAAFSAIGAQLEAAFSRMMLGEALAASGERAGAVEALRAAETTLDRAGCGRLRDEARRALRKLGARAEVRGPASADDSGLGSLSKREREIANLITERFTNPEIADKLFLSKKTVESHVRNLFVKLSASSRVEVARIVERDRREHDDA